MIWRNFSGWHSKTFQKYFSYTNTVWKIENFFLSNQFRVKFFSKTLIWEKAVAVKFHDFHILTKVWQCSNWFENFLRKSQFYKSQTFATNFKNPLISRNFCQAQKTALKSFILAKLWKSFKNRQFHMILADLSKGLTCLFALVLVKLPGIIHKFFKICPKSWLVCAVFTF